MAPPKGKSGGSKGGASKSGASKGAKKSGSGGGSKSSSSRPSSSSSFKSKKPTGVLPKSATSERKTQRISHGPQKKKKRVYTDKELNIPTLNGIKPAGVQKAHGMKKGKTFVDDKETMMTILALVQAEKEGNIESKMMRARQMEEIREARKAEMEKKSEGKRKVIEDTKDEIRRSKKKNKGGSDNNTQEKSVGDEKPRKKRVSFG